MNKNLLKIAEKRAEYTDHKNKQTLIIIEQIHHSYEKNPDKKLKKAINSLQEVIFQMLTELDSEGHDLLGLEDISYTDNEEVDAEEAASMAAYNADEISQWQYEKRYPKHFKTFCVDVVNMFGIRSGMAFAAEKLLGKEEILKKQHDFLIELLESQFAELDDAQKRKFLTKMREAKEKYPKTSDTSLFFAIVINSLVKGLLEGMGELFSAVKIIEYALVQSKSAKKWDTTDNTEQLLNEIRQEFVDFVKEFFMKAEKKADSSQNIALFDLYFKTFIQFISQNYQNALTMAPKADFLMDTWRCEQVIKNCLKTLQNENSDEMIIVFGAAHSNTLLEECKKQGLNCVVLRPKHQLWEKLGI